MDIYGFMNSADVAGYCRSIGKTWNPFEMAVIVGRSSNSTMADRHRAWRELITDYPDMATPATEEWQSFGSLHGKLAEIIDFDERMLELFIMPEEGTFYRNTIDDEYSAWWYEEETFADYDSANASLMNELKCVREWKREKIQRITIEKFYIGHKKSIECTYDTSGNILRIIDAYRVQMFPDTDSSEFLDLSPGFDHEEAYYVDIPVPFKRGDILQRRRYAWQSGEPFVLDSLADREKIYAERMGEAKERAQSNDNGWIAMSMSGEAIRGICGWVYSVNKRKALCIDDEYDNDCLEFYHGTLEREKNILRYISMYLKGEIDLRALLMLQGKIIEEHNLKMDWRLCDCGFELPQSILDVESPRRIGDQIVDPTIYTGIF